MQSPPLPPLGATLRDGGVEVRVWAPDARACALEIDGRELPMVAEGSGTFAALAPGAGRGSRYGVRLLGDDGVWGPPFPDPCSRSQPEGVHALSEVIDPAAFPWTDAAWMAGPEARVPLERLVFYELHVGTFTPEGTFAAAAARLEHIRDLGATAVELMPLHAFPGRFNWGYDPGAFLAPPAAYGSPDDLRRLVDRAHALGLAVVVDVVLNHLGPDGAYVNAFAPMLAPAPTPWGAAVNLDGPDSEGVRRFLIEAALVWLTDYHADALRLDATSRLLDTTTQHFMAELSSAVASLPGARRYLVAEDLRNRAVVTRPREHDGYGIDSQWVDDLAAMARQLAGDDQPFYGDYANANARTVAAALLDGWWLTQPAIRKQSALAGTAPEGPLPRVTHYLDNHDQAGNRPHGEPLTALAPPSLLRALNAVLLFAPQLPLLWMGQEWGSTAPFPFFADHGEPLAQSVRDGRRREHEAWWRFEGQPPDPADPATFASAKLDWSAIDRPEGQAALALHRRLLALRASMFTDGHPPAWHVEAPSDATLLLSRGVYVMLVALKPDVSLHDPGGSALFSTEDAPFAPGGSPPVRSEGFVHFAVPSALLLSTRRS